jgi:flavodoxin I
METLIVYDSYFSNTEKVAKTIAEELKSTKIKNVKDFKPKDLKDIELLIVGSPTRAFNFSDNIKAFFSKLSNTELKGKKVAAFDTRIDHKEVKPKILGFLMKIFGYASEKILKELVKRGGQEITEPGGFIVLDKEGPLRKTEVERAKEWVNNFYLK